MGCLFYCLPFERIDEEVMTVVNDVNTIRFYRRLRELAQGDVAVALGKSQTWVSLVEKGCLRPSREDAKKLADILGIAVTDVSTRERR